MKKAGYILLAVSCIIGIDQACCAQTDRELFHRYFTFTDTVSFTMDSLLIGSIQQVVPLGQERYVIKENVMRPAVWVDMRKNIYRELTLEKELPGENCSPLALVKDPSGGFWMATVHYYIKCNANGNYQDRYKNETYFVSDKFCIDSLSNLLVYCQQESVKDHYLLYFNLKTNDMYPMIKLGFSEKYYNAIKRMDGGGVLIDRDEFVYVANPIENNIFKYSTDGTLVKSFSSRHVPYQILKKDLLPGQQGVLEFFQRPESKRRLTTIQCLGFINDTTIYAQYSGCQGKFIEVFLTDGMVVNTEILPVPKGMGAAGSAENCIYFYDVMRVDEKPGEVRNPVLLRYRFEIK